jgi:hypothetical protein
MAVVAVGLLYVVLSPLQLKLEVGPRVAQTLDDLLDWNPNL